MNVELEIGKRIKSRREELEMTQEQLGNLLWLNKSTIQRYETGKINKIKLPILHAMAKQLDVNPNWLALKTDEKGHFSDEPNWYNSINLNLDAKTLLEGEKYEESSNPDIRMIARAGKKMTPEQAENLRKYAEFMFPEAFDDTTKEKK